MPVYADGFLKATGRNHDDDSYRIDDFQAWVVIRSIKSGNFPLSIRRGHFSAKLADRLAAAAAAASFRFIHSSLSQSSSSLETRENYRAAIIEIVIVMRSRLKSRGGLAFNELNRARDVS